MKDSLMEFYPLADWIGDKVNLIAEKADGLLDVIFNEIE